jgi:hypothetical protein
VYYKCVKCHKNPISRLGGVALTRYMDRRTDGRTDGQGDSYIPVLKDCNEIVLRNGLGGRVVYVASLNTTTVDHQSIISMVIVQSLLCA